VEDTAAFEGLAAAVDLSMEAPSQCFNPLR
jgi:hypothetical protein